MKSKTKVMSMITKNKKKKDCSVVAAFNAAWWCDKPKTYKEIEKIAKSCGYSDSTGIYNFQFFHLMKKLEIPAKKIEPKSMGDLKNAVYKGKCLIFLYVPTGKDTGHAIVAFLDHEGKIRFVNPEKKRARRSWSALATDIRQNGMKEFYVYEIPNRSMAKRYDVTRTA